ncbi:beta-galactosidase [Lentzea sp. NBRC 105346]|uniref:glycoside hydrolase family 2 TIM barrel-domain containing protein n=1 Tax=Lentzea sp. NBRC 105346 TaxID=3032205 RepID=UPI0024A1FEA3|nr:glycoside hydrolase family 2 TIM barrel-domain containing protein [Lentzea sp. NBRC 105346]GLZ33786.1 beta-galactosidase [Lentzea sp. NBRC 105346]
MSWRRLFFVLLLVVGVTGGMPAQAATARSESFNQGWRFALVNSENATDPTGAYEKAYEPSYDDSKWRQLNVPHDWSIELDPTKTGTYPGEGYYRAGLGWYRKTFTLPASLKGKRISLEFDGVYMDSHVYVNGKLAAEHPYGYTGFNVDITDVAKTDGSPNVVAVKVVHQSQSSRWYAGSGIYRNVHLVVTEPVHVARHGIFVTTPDLATTYPHGYAKINVKTDLVGTGTVSHEVLDAQGNVVSDANLRVNQPKLWNTAQPYLYTLVTKVSSGGKVVDTVRTPFGIRWFKFDPANGFSLNGKGMKLEGVNLHSTLGALGAVVDDDAIRQQLRKMKDMGVNAVRTSHNPPAPEFVRACDELGLLLMVEAFDTWRTPKKPYDYGRFFDANSDADIKEMVHAAKNSPAVILWSIGNEIPDGTKDIGIPIARRLIDDIKSIDKTRPVTIGSHSYTSVPADGSPQDQILKMLDGVGLNYNSAKSIDALHAKYPTKFFLESESSSSTSSRGEYLDPGQLNTGQNYTPGKQGSSSYDNNIVGWAASGEHALKKDRDRKFLAGEFIWSGQDYIGEPTPYNGVFPVRSSLFGAVDTAGFEKDQFYLYQSQWSTTPMVHLVPMNWTDHEPGAKVTVWAYSNAPEVELFLNGKSLGTRKFTSKKTTYGKSYLETDEATGDDKSFPSGSYTSPNGSTGHLRLTWTVPFAPGTLTAVARKGGKEVATDTLRTAGAAASVKLDVSRGKSLDYVTATIVDKDGNIVPSADHQITFDVTGGRVVGTDNGRQEDKENFTSPVRRAYHGKVLAIVTAGAQVTARLGAASTRPPADASYSGAASTLPAAMLDGKADTAWSNFYTKGQTPQLAATSLSHASDWVSLDSSSRQVSKLTAHFTTGGQFALPKSVDVRYWDGSKYVPVKGLKVTWASESNAPSTIAFDAVTTTSVRLVMTSPTPSTSNGFLKIAELAAS